MHDHPSADEMLDAVCRFLTDTAAPNLTGQAAFHARVAANALAIVRREIAARPAAEAAERARLAALLGADGAADELNRALAEAIRTGATTLETPGLLAHLKATTIAQVAIDQPGYSGLAAVRGDER